MRPVWSLLLVDQSPAAFWMVNPDNIVRGNVCIDDQVEHTQLDSIREVRPAGSNIVADNPCFLTTPRPEKKKEPQPSLMCASTRMVQGVSSGVGEGDGSAMPAREQGAPV